MRFLLNHPRAIFAALFALILAGLFGWEALYVWPQKSCEKRADHLWAEKFHACAHLVSTRVLAKGILPAARPGGPPGP